MAGQDFALNVGLLANTDELEKQIKDGNYEANVDLNGSGGGRRVTGGNSTSRSAAIGGAIGGILGNILSQLEIVTALLDLIGRFFTLTLAPLISAVLSLLDPLLKLFFQGVPLLIDAAQQLPQFLSNIVDSAVNTFNSIVGRLQNIPFIGEALGGGGGSQTGGGVDAGDAARAGLNAASFVSNPIGFAASQLVDQSDEAVQQWLTDLVNNLGGKPK